jgi:predicted alpha/beta-fold hydrolase
MLTVLTAPKERGGLGMRAVVQNSRGCNGLPIVTPKLYNVGIFAPVSWFCSASLASRLARRTTSGRRCSGFRRHSLDLLSTVLVCAATRFRTWSAFLLCMGVKTGFSLGANCITKYVGEEGDACPFSGCVSVGNPYDFLAANRHIETYSFITKYVYNYALGGALQALLSRHKDIFLSHPDSPLPADVLKEYLEERAVGMRQFDEVITRRVFGYADAYDYYAHNSSTRFIEGIRVPYLGLNALDDPITGVHTLPILQAKMNPWVLLVRTEHGGHLGWFETASDGSLGRWYVRPLREWFEALLEVRYFHSSDSMID